MSTTKKKATSTEKVPSPAPAPTEKERLTVRVDPTTFGVYSGVGKGGDRIGTVLSMTVNDGARTPTGGKFTSRRITVKLRNDAERLWVGQFSNASWNTHTARKVVILRPWQETE